MSPYLSEVNLMWTLCPPPPNEYTHLVLAAPTVDITNLDKSKLITDDNIEYIKQKIAASCQNVFTMTHETIKKKPNIEKVIIMEHAPRFGQKHIDPIHIL